MSDDELEYFPTIVARKQAYVVLNWDAGQDRCYVKVFTTKEHMMKYFKKRSGLKTKKRF